jgi:competence protein ComEC
LFSPSFFTNISYDYLPPTHASLLNGILFGVQVSRYSLLYQHLKEVGLVHIVVLSGMNITILSTVVLNITARLSKKISIIITMISIIVFILFVGPQPPIVRAGCMSILVLLATLFGRKTLSLYILFLSGLIVGIMVPAWLTSISFQLSYAATLGLILFNQPIKQQKTDTKKTSLFSALMAYAKMELYTSLAAQVFIVPLIFFYFKQISFISPLANILVAWTIAPIMFVGLLTVILGKIHFVLGLLPSYVAYGLISYLIFIVELLEKIPFASVSF